MAKFFDYFPKTAYDIANRRLKNYQAVTNIFYRLRVVREVISNISAYYEYIIRDGDTPENLADKVYKNPEAHWIILMANDIVDAAYDWPLNENDFKRYIVAKYKERAAYHLSKSVDEITDWEVISWTQNLTSANSIHHYEKVIQRTETLSGTVSEARFTINEKPYANTVYYGKTKRNVEIILTNTVANNVFYSGNTVNTTNNIFVGTVTAYEPSNGYICITGASGYFLRDQKIQVANNLTTNGIASLVLSPSGRLIQDPAIPYFSYVDLAAEQYVEVTNMGYLNSNTTSTTVNAGRSVVQVSKRDAVSIYDYELSVNEAKRPIKIIKPEYYPRIIEEFNSLTETARNPFIRRLI